MAATSILLLAACASLSYGASRSEPASLAFTNVDELELLVAAGLTPVEALRAATLGPAQYLEATDSLGTVAPGRLADLVLLEANPLEDIRNAQRISAVVADGRYFDRQTLDRLLAEVEAAAVGEDVAYVAPPTGERDADRASILAALAQVRPGGTVQFAPGTYLVGEFIAVSVPRVTLLGHVEGTTLRGCDPAAWAGMEPEAAVVACNGLELIGGFQTVRDLTFEYAWNALLVGVRPPIMALAPPEGGWPTEPVEAGTGGHLVERNTFRNSVNGIRVVGGFTEPAVIRANRFVNLFHAVVVNGKTAHILDNDISVPEPGRVPGWGHPSIALSIAPAPWTPACEHNVVAGNRIEGHPEGIDIAVFPPGASCRQNAIRDNTILVRRVPFRSRMGVRVTSEGDSTLAGVPLALVNLAENGTLEDNLIEGNTILGAEGLGIQIVRASSNRIVNNTINGISSREPFPGNTLGDDPLVWRNANGSGIWLSRGSDQSEIIGNTFDDVASHAIVLEGDRNVVETRGEADRVRDLGIGNRIGTTEPAAAHDVDGLMTRFIRALNDESVRFLAPFFAPDAVLVGGGGEVLTGRESVLEEYFRPVVARIRGLEPVFSRTLADDAIATVVTTYTARLAPATEPGQGVFTTTWRRQPDDSWLIVAGTFELPRYEGPVTEQPIRSGLFHSDGVRLNYVDFGGDGVPLVFVHSGDRTGYTFMEFAPGFTDRNRVLAISQRGAGLSEGDPAPGVPRAILARDIITMLDSLALERAVVAGQWDDLLIHLAEEYPNRIAGLVFLESHATFEPDESLQQQDPIGVLRMLELNRAALWGGVTEPTHPELDQGPRYLRPGSTIDVPALSFVTEASWPDDMWDEILGLAGLAERSAALFPGHRIRAYFQRLATDEAMQEQGRVFWRDVVAPSLRARRDALERAFGDRLRSVPVEPRAIGYGYRDTPDLIAPHIRQFLDEVQRRERRRRN